GAIDAWFAPDGARLLTASGTGLELWRVDRAPLLGELVPAASLHAAVFGPDERRVAVAADDGQAAIWDLARGQREAILAAPGPARGDINGSRNGARLVVAGAQGGVEVHAADGGATVRLGGHRGTVNRAAFSPDGARVVTAGDDGAARIWDAATGASL